MGTEKGHENVEESKDDTEKEKLERKKEEADAALNKKASSGFDGQHSKAWAAYIANLDSGKFHDIYLDRLQVAKRGKVGEECSIDGFISIFRIGLTQLLPSNSAMIASTTFFMKKLKVIGFSGDE